MERGAHLAVVAGDEVREQVEVVRGAGQHLTLTRRRRKARRISRQRLTGQFQSLDPRPEQRRMSWLVPPQHCEETEGARQLVAKAGTEVFVVGRPVRFRRFRPRAWRRLGQVLAIRTIAESNGALECGVRLPEVMPPRCKHQDVL